MWSQFAMDTFRKVVLLAVAFLVGTASEASATLGIENHNDPAGDPTPMNYRLESPSFSSPINFTLTDGLYTSFGVQPGTYTVQGLPPVGWAVGDIQCVGPDPADFVIDVANGRVTVTHGAGEEHICAFTNRKISRAIRRSSASGLGAATSRRRSASRGGRSSSAGCSGTRPASSEGSE
jgi:hypothetical protein